MYMALDGNITIEQLCRSQSVDGSVVDLRRFVAFGHFTGILKRLHRYPCLTRTQSSAVAQLRILSREHAGGFTAAELDELMLSPRSRSASPQTPGMATNSVPRTGSMASISSIESDRDSTAPPRTAGGARGAGSQGTPQEQRSRGSSEAGAQLSFSAMYVPTLCKYYSRSYNDADHVVVALCRYEDDPTPENSKVRRSRGSSESVGSFSGSACCLPPKAFH